MSKHTTENKKLHITYTKRTTLKSRALTITKTIVATKLQVTLTTIPTVILTMLIGLTARSVLINARKISRTVLNND